jgi:hypothetical protein
MIFPFIVSTGFDSRRFRYGVARGDDEEKNRRTTTALGQMIAKQLCRQSRCRLAVLMALHFVSATCCAAAATGSSSPGIGPEPASEFAIATAPSKLGPLGPTCAGRTVR